jgi:hypothetical protein
MKTVWNVISENEITDHPTVQTFANENDALAMVTELFREYCNEHDLDPFDPDLLDEESFADTKFFRFSGGDWEEWVYVMETEITPPTVGAAILMTDKDI